MVMDNIDVDVFSGGDTNGWWNDGNIDDGDDVQSEEAQKPEGYWGPVRAPHVSWHWITVSNSPLTFCKVQAFRDNDDDYVHNHYTFDQFWNLSRCLLI